MEWVIYQNHYPILYPKEVRITAIENTIPDKSMFCWVYWGREKWLRITD